jgi:indole-3-glycerol phosphate synthase
VNHLERIVEATREEVARRIVALPETELRQAGAARTAGGGDVRDFRAALAAPGLSVIAEHKRRSPSAGVIRDGASLAEIVGAYERGGAAALSVLTDGPSFGGSLADLAAARAAAGLPILRKDFIVEPYQVHEAYAAGADAILLIVAALSPDQLAELHGLARSLGLDVLVEVHDDVELELAAAAGAPIIGVNNRDLTTLRVDTGRTFELVPLMPPGAVVVAESGFSTREQLLALAQARVDAVLIGEALMRSEDVETACRELAAL